VHDCVCRLIMSVKSSVFSVFGVVHYPGVSVQSNDTCTGLFHVFTGVCYNSAPTYFQCQVIKFQELSVAESFVPVKINICECHK